MESAFPSLPSAPNKDILHRNREMFFELTSENIFRRIRTHGEGATRAIIYSIEEDILPISPRIPESLGKVAHYARGEQWNSDKPLPSLHTLAYDFYSGALCGFYTIHQTAEPDFSRYLETTTTMYGSMSAQTPTNTQRMIDLVSTNGLSTFSKHQYDTVSRLYDGLYQPGSQTTLTHSEFCFRQGYGYVIGEQRKYRTMTEQTLKTTLAHINDFDTDQVGPDPRDTLVQTITRYALRQNQ